MLLLTYGMTYDKIWLTKGSNTLKSTVVPTYPAINLLFEIELLFIDKYIFVLQIVTSKVRSNVVSKVKASATGWSGTRI